MELRSDIAAAASRLTSGHEVQREIRQLVAYLREGESVQRLTSGIYGTGSGLLAVTDHRVLLLRDGRSGQASEGFPLGRLSTAVWAPNGARGTITVSDSHSTTELREVPAAEGAEVVAHIQSLAEPEADVASIRRWSNPGIPGPTDHRGMPPGGENPWETRGRVGSPADRTGHAGGPPPAAGPGNPVPSQTGAHQPATTGGWSASNGWTPTGSWPVQGATNADSGPGTMAQGGVPVSVLARTSTPTSPPTTPSMPSTVPSTTTRIPEQQQPWGSGSGAAVRRGPAPGAELSAGEVSIRQLAAETSQDLAVVPTDPDQEPEPSAGRDAFTTGGNPIPDVDDVVDTEQERRQPIRWTGPSRAVRRGVESTTSGTRAPGRVGSGTGATRLPTRVEATDRPRDEVPGRDRRGRGKKWMWVSAGAVGLVGLAALGSFKLISTTTPAATPVNPAPAAINAAAGPTVTITKVIDADTVDVTGPYTGTVEILGIVAPRADKNQCGATESKAWATKKLNNASVVLVSDPGQPATDRNGHKQAFLRKPDGSDYSVAAAKAGMVHFYDSQPPVGNAADIKAAEAQAEQDKAGLWAAPCNGKFTSTGTSGAGVSTSGTGSSSSSTGTGSSSRSGTTGTRSDSTGTGN